MIRLGYCLAKIRYKLKHNNHEIMSAYYRGRGASIGSNCCICSNLDNCDSFMLSIGNGVTISTDVTFVTHDHSIYHIRHNDGDLFGKIIIGNNCFIGEKAILMYGVSLADNIIVAAGSVVTKSFSRGNIIIGGNPATVIGTWDRFGAKYKDNHFEGWADILNSAKTEDERFIVRKDYYDDKS